MTVKCEVCNKEFKDKKALAVHTRKRKKLTECAIYYENKRKTLESEREEKHGYIICAICNEKLGNISNTHLRKHGITQQEYIKLYGNVFPDKLVFSQKEKREKTINEKYTPEEQKHYRGKKGIQTKIEKYGSISNLHKTYWERDPNTMMNSVITAASAKSDKIQRMRLESPQEYEEYNRQILMKRVETNIQRYGVPFTQFLPETKLKQENTLVEKYGSLENAYKIFSQRSLESRYRKYGRYAKFFPMFSILSQDLFSEIEIRLSHISGFRYATNGIEKNNEFQVLVCRGNKLRFLDFHIENTPIWIEYDEQYHLSEEQIILDERRTGEIIKEMPNLKLLRISENEYIFDREHTIKKCIKFILDEIGVA